MNKGILEFVLLKYGDIVKIYAFDVTNITQKPMERTNIYRLAQDGKQSFIGYNELKSSPCKFSDVKQIIKNFYSSRSSQYTLSPILLCDTITKVVYLAEDFNSDFRKILDCSPDVIW